MHLLRRTRSGGWAASPSRRWALVARAGRRGASTLVVAIAVASCATMGPLEEPLPEWTSCRETADCTLVEIGCCSCKTVAVRRDRAAEALLLLKERDCNGDCPEIGCYPPSAVCTDGRCVSKPRTGW